MVFCPYAVMTMAYYWQELCSDENQTITKFIQILNVNEANEELKLETPKETDDTSTLAENRQSGLNFVFWSNAEWELHGGGQNEWW